LTRKSKEPSVGFDRLKAVYEVENYDPISGEYVTSEESIAYNVFDVNGILDIKPVRAERSNLVVRAGLNYLYGSISEEYTDTTYDDHLWKFGIVGGMGIEHFFTDHFSVYAGFLNGINFLGTEDEDLKSFGFANVGNQFAELTFVWYLK
jgi:hypothetical protein